MQICNYECKAISYILVLFNVHQCRSRKEPTAVPFSVEDEENFSGQRGNFAPFPPGFSQGAPPRYNFGGMQAPRPDSPSGTYPLEWHHATDVVLNSSL